MCSSVVLGVHGGEAREYLKAVTQGIDWAAWAFNSLYAFIGIESHDKYVAKFLCSPQVRHVTAMQDIKAAIRKDDPFSRCVIAVAHLLQAVEVRDYF